MKQIQLYYSLILILLHVKIEMFNTILNHCKKINIFQLFYFSEIVFLIE